MKTDFDAMLRKFESSFVYVDDSKDLNELRETYSKFEQYKSELIEWVADKFSNEEELLVEYSNIIGKKEYDLVVGKGIPVFGEKEISFDDIEKIFDDNVSYFQRYGCLGVDQILSWDDTDVLIEDEIGNLEIVKRPDILMNV